MIFLTLSLFYATKFWWNEITSSAAHKCVINCQLYLNFSKAENLCPYFLVMLKSVFELSYNTRKTCVNNFCLIFQRTFYFLLVSRTDNSFGLFWDIQMNFLKNVVSLLWLIWGKSYRNLNFKNIKTLSQQHLSFAFSISKKLFSRFNKSALSILFSLHSPQICMNASQTFLLKH